MGRRRGGVRRWGEREITYLFLHCHHQNDSYIKMRSNKSHFNVSSIVRDRVTRRCPQTTTFEEKADSNQNPSAYQPNALPLGQTGSHCVSPWRVHLYLWCPCWWGDRPRSVVIWRKGSDFIGCLWSVLLYVSVSSPNFPSWRLGWGSHQQNLYLHHTYLPSWRLW